MPSMATGVSRSTTKMRRGSAYLVRGRGSSVPQYEHEVTGAAYLSKEEDGRLQGVGLGVRARGWG